MSVNGIHGQMQTWLNGHGENMANCSNGLDKVLEKMDSFSKLLEGELGEKISASGMQDKMLEEIENEFYDVVNSYLEKENELGKSFNFMEGDYDITDAETFVPAYLEQTGKLAQGDMDAWETDGEEGISLEEYKASQINSPETESMSDDELAALDSYTEGSFKVIDIDGDGIIEKNELQGFYAALDNTDGSVDGNLDIDSISNTDFTSEKFAKNIQDFQYFITPEEESEE